jgi:hypothetical protein
MDVIFKKLNFKDHKMVVLLNSPDSFASNVQSMAGLTDFYTDISSIEKANFVLAFVTTQVEIDTIAANLFPKLEGDATVWFCYPKGSSKKLKCDFNRDTGWATLAPYNYEPVRQVAIDEDWSALRFRNVDFIKTITRRADYALTDAAKARTTASPDPSLGGEIVAV